MKSTWCLAALITCPIILMHGCASAKTQSQRSKAERLYAATRGMTEDQVDARLRAEPLADQLEAHVWALQHTHPPDLSLGQVLMRRGPQMVPLVVDRVERKDIGTESVFLVSLVAIMCNNTLDVETSVDAERLSKACSRNWPPGSECHRSAAKTQSCGTTAPHPAETSAQ